METYKFPSKAFPSPSIPNLEMERNMKEGSDLSLDEYMEKRLEEWSVAPSEKEPCTIYRVPSHLRKEDESAYQPKIISIGPYHHCDNGLKDMEEHKWQFLSEFLKRNHRVPLKHYLDKVREKEMNARNHYSEKVHLSSDDFVQMMVLDGCFIIELFLKRYKAKDDMIYSTRWILPLITNDMLLLENQLPFFILQELFQMADLGIHDGKNLITINSLAIHFFSHLLVGDDKSLPGEQEPFHLLHLLHLFHTRRLKDSPDGSQATDSNKMQHNSSQTPPQQPLTNSSHSDIEAQPPETELIKKTGRFGNRQWKGVVFLLQTIIGFPRKPSPPQKSIPCATELHEAGVEFRVKKDANSYLEVTFGDGVMEIPYLLIKNNTNSLFRNFIAFEQCRPDSNCHFTSYAFFMDCIVNTPADVALLCQNKILEHWLGSDDAVALLFNKLCYGVAMDTQTRHYFPNLFQEVRKYCNTTWHTWRARLMHDYFSNPWAIVSVVAAIILLLLTIAQTFFSTIAYVKPPA